MPKHEKNSPKAMANKIKSKGLQKLRWFCQMCQKQCRDQNGFKCHLTSESHQRQLLLFAENKNSYLREFSTEFEKTFMQILRHSFGAKRVRANEVYQEYIKERSHVHMNSTVWHTLSGFVQYLGRSGKCKIDMTEKGWYIQYIDKEEEMRREKLAEKVKADRDDDERMADFIQRQADRALENLAEKMDDNQTAPTEMIRNDGEKISFALNVQRKPTKNELDNLQSTAIKTPQLFDNDVKPDKKKLDDDRRKHENDKKSTKKRRDDDRRSESKRHRREHDDDKHSHRTSSSSHTKKSSVLDEIRKTEERMKEEKNRKDNWLHTGIVVQVMTKKLGNDYYKKKGIVIAIDNEYTAKVEILDEKGDILKLDQVHLETVIPAVGKKVLIVNGAYRGHRAIMEKIDQSNSCVSIRIDDGIEQGRLLERMEYEDVCKLA